MYTKTIEIFINTHKIFRAELEEKQHVISTLNTKITLLKDGLAEQDVNNLATTNEVILKDELLY